MESSIKVAGGLLPVLPGWLRGLLSPPGGRGHPAVGRRCCGTHPEVCPHGVPGRGEGVRQVVEPGLGVHAPDHFTTEVGNWGK